MRLGGSVGRRSRHLQGEKIETKEQKKTNQILRGRHFQGMSRIKTRAGGKVLKNVETGKMNVAEQEQAWFSQRGGARGRKARG